MDFAARSIRARGVPEMLASCASRRRATPCREDRCARHCRRGALPVCCHVRCAIGRTALSTRDPVASQRVRRTGRFPCVRVVVPMPTMLARCLLSLAAREGRPSQDTLLLRSSWDARGRRKPRIRTPLHMECSRSKTVYPHERTRAASRERTRSVPIAGDGPSLLAPRPRKFRQARWSLPPESLPPRQWGRRDDQDFHNALTRLR